MRYADVILPQPVQRNYLTYSVPENESDTIVPGAMVCVPLGYGRILTALVVRCYESEIPLPYSTKPIIELLPYAPLPSHSLKLLLWAFEYYMCSSSDVLNAAIPISFRPDGNVQYQFTNSDRDDIADSLQKLLPLHFTLSSLQQQLGKAATKQLTSWLQKGVVEPVVTSDKTKNRPHIKHGWILNQDLLKHNSKYEEVVEQLRKSPVASRLLARLHEETLQLSTLPVSLSTLAEQYGVSIAVIKKLRDTEVFIEGSYNTDEIPLEGLPTQHNLQDTITQALYQELSTSPSNIVLAHLQNHTLLERIPYAFLADKIAQGKQVLLLFPTLEELQIATQQLKIKIPSEYLYFYHSGLSTVHRNKHWHAALIGKPGVYIGLRSAVWLPLRNIGSIVVIDEEHRNYRQYEPAPRFNALQVALYLGYLTKVPTLLTTATPSIERKLLAHDKRYGYIHLTKAPPSFTLETISLIDSFQKNKIKGRLISFKLLQALMTTINEGGKALLLFQRKGYARQVRCKECATVITCPVCYTSYRYYEHSKHLVCPLCGHHEEIPKLCPKCFKAHSIILSGTGVERLYEEITQLFPHISIAQSNDNLEKQYFAQILLSAQSDVPVRLLQQYTLIALVQYDLLTTLPDFRANERAYQLLTHYALSAPKLKRMIVQYLLPQISLEAFERKGYDYLYKQELEERHSIKYPPFSRMIDIYIEGGERESVLSSTQSLAKEIQSQFAKSILLGPAPLLTHKRNVSVGYKLSLLLPFEAPLAVSKHTLNSLVEKHKSNHTECHIYFDVDPSY